jgi:hypothetical protein
MTKMRKGRRFRSWDYSRAGFGAKRRAVVSSYRRITSFPTHGRNTSGTVTDPSAS